MSLLTRETLRELLRPEGGPCLSFFMPAHRHPPGADQDPIRFRNLLREARGRLGERSGVDVGQLLGPLEELAASPFFWRGQDDGLALFRAPRVLEHFPLPEPPPERLVISDTFHVKPLVKALQSSRRYHVLALSRGRVALYEGTRSGLRAVDLRGLPASLRDALGVEEEEPHLQYRTLRAGSSAPIYHGHGLPEAAREDELRRFFRVIDRALDAARLAEEGVPLLLAGVRHYFPIFHDVSRYPQLAADGVEGNFDAASASELHARAWPVARRIFDRRLEEALAAYGAAVDRKLASVDPVAIGRSMAEGRIRLLLLAERAEVPGRLDGETGAIGPPAADEEGDEVLDDLAEGVLLRGGEVLVVPGDQMPSGSAVAAILRW